MGELAVRGTETVRRRGITLRILVPTLACLGAFLWHVGPAHAGPVPATGERTTPEDRDLRLARALEDEMVGAVERVRGASVSILQRRRMRGSDGKALGGPPVVSSVGSGVVVSHRGTWILTNLHVISGADLLEAVTADGRVHRVSVKAKLERNDLAVLAFSKPPAGVEPVRLPLAGARCVEVGQLVLATGNPFFLANDGASVATLGVASAPARWMEGNLLHGRTIQHDASVNPGNSGGPLWSLDGRLLGINETIATHSRAMGMGPCSTGASFSIAVDQVRRALGEMVDPAGERVAVWRGLRFTTARDAVDAGSGAEVGDPQGRSGEYVLDLLALRRGDVVTAVTLLPQAGRDDSRRTQVSTAADLPKAFSGAGGRRVRIDSRREDVQRSWTGTLPAAP